MKNFGIAGWIAGLGLVMALGGCKSKPSAADLEKMKTEACACTDKACADKVEKKMTDALDGVSAGDLDEKSMALTMEIAVCLGKAGAGMGGGGEAPAEAPK